MSGQKQILFNQIAADDTSKQFVSRISGPAIVTIRATSYGTGTITIQMADLSDGATPRFVTLTDGTLTADATLNLTFLPAGHAIQAVLAGSTAASNVYVSIAQ